MTVRKTTLLANHLRHAGTHNKIQEEREMWRLRKLELDSNLQDFLNPPKQRTPITSGRLLSDSFHDSDTEERERIHEEAELPPTQSYYWTRKLMKAKEDDPYRWGHSGYKELHPEEFLSTDEEEKNREAVKKRHKRKRRSKSERKTSKLKRGKCSDSEDSSVEEEYRRKSVKKKSSRKKKEKIKRR